MHIVKTVLRLSLCTAVMILAAAPALAGQLHVHTSGEAGFHTHSVWYDDGKEVTVVDTQFTPALAEALLADIRSQTASPVTRIIVTHPSPDKFNALSIFHAAGAESISSAATAAAMPGVDAYKRYFWTKIAAAFTEETYPKMEAVRSTFSGKRIVKLASGETLTLFELTGPGVSSTQTVVRIDTTGDLVVGDLVSTGAHAWLEGGIVEGKPTPALAQWKRDLRQLRRLGRGKVYGGRGNFVGVDQAVREQIAYLDKAEAIVKRYVEGLGERRSELADPQKQAVHFAAIQAAFVEAFPGYALPELIGYGVYGLAQQLAR